MNPWNFQNTSNLPHPTHPTYPTYLTSNTPYLIFFSLKKQKYIGTLCLLLYEVKMDR